MSAKALSFKKKSRPPGSNDSGISEFNTNDVEAEPEQQQMPRRESNESRVSRAVSIVSKKVGKAMHGSRAQSKLVKNVFQQAVAYLAAFYVTWPLLGSSYLVSGINVDHTFSLYWYWLLVAMLAPLQGKTFPRFISAYLQ